MTVTEYRRKHPDCEYCLHRIPPFDYCRATNKKISKNRAKKCLCYVAEEWRLDNLVKEMTEGV